MSLLTHKIQAIKKQVENEKFLKENNLLGIAQGLVVKYSNLFFGDQTPTEKMIQYKKEDKYDAFILLWDHMPQAKDLWEVDNFEEAISRMVIYWNKKLFEGEHTITNLFLKSELPSGELQFYPELYEQKKPRMSPNSQEALFKMIFGDTNRLINLSGSVKKKEEDIILLPSPESHEIWTVEEGMVSFTSFKKIAAGIAARLAPFFYKKVNDDLDEKIASKEELDKISQAKEYIKNKDNFPKAASIDNMRIAASAKKAAEISFSTKDDLYPIFTEISFTGKRIPVPTLLLYRAVNITLYGSDSCQIYYDEQGQKIIIESQDTFSIIDVDFHNANLWNSINLEAFTKGITARQVEKIEAVVKVESFDAPADLLDRKTKLKEILERQKELVPKFQQGGVLRRNAYDEIIQLAHEYVASYTKIVNERGVEIRKAIIPQHKLNNLSYVYEVDDIFWEYNTEIEIEELLAFFVSKGKNENYQLLCLKILGIDYMLNYNVIVDSLIERRLLMIDNIKIDYVTKRILDLKYEYLYLYASGNIYSKKKDLERIQADLLEYYGNDQGMRIIAAQNEILDEKTPPQCQIISAEKDKQLELDINHALFFEKDFPLISTRSSVGVRSIRDQFKDYFHKMPKLGGIKDIDIEDGYFEPLDKSSFIKKYILPNWKHKGRTYNFESSSWTSIVEALQMKPEKDPSKKGRGGQEIYALSDYAKDDQIEIKDIQRAMMAAYHEKITRIKNEGSRLFNLFLKSEVSNSFQQVISQRWNETYNNYSAAQLDRVPTFFRIARYFGTDNKLFRLKKVQVHGVRFFIARNNSALLAHEVGYGKMQPLDAKILTPTGWKLMGDIAVGDQVIGSDGRPTDVLEIFPHGEKDIYKITFSDGSSTECGKEHLWTVISETNKFRKGNNITLSTGQLMDKNGEVEITGKYNPSSKSHQKYKCNTYYKRKNGIQNKWQIPIVKPVHFEKQEHELPLHPYLLGALLGDGSFGNEGTIGLTCADDEMVDFLNLILPNNELRVNRIKTTTTRKQIQFNIGRPYGSKSRNEISGIINDLGLRGTKSDTKFIPDIYKYSSIENRIWLLKGLMDTDGTTKIIKNSSQLSYCTISEKLYEDFVFLVRSLGGVTTTYKRKCNYTYKGEKKTGKLSYNVFINLPPEIIPFNLSRKLEKHIPKYKYLPARVIDNIEYVGKKESQCISVSNEDGLYVTDDLIVTHNTTSSLAIMSHMIEVGDASRILALTPKRVYEKFLREGRGAGNFRGAIPHINFVELENAKPDVFLPVVNSKGEVVKWKLKKYDPSELKLIESYRQAVAEISKKAESMQNRRIEADQASVDLIDQTIAAFIPGYTKYKFLDDMVKRIGYDKDYAIKAINDEKAEIKNKQGAISPKEEERIKIKFSREFAEETMEILYSMRKIMVDELGEFFPEVFKPKSIIMATHVAIEELRPTQEGIDEAIKTIDDVTDVRYSTKLRREIPDARDKTLDWSFSLNNNPISVEKLNIDGIVVDEVHNFNELVSKIRPRYFVEKRERGREVLSYFKLPIGSRDSKGRHVMRYYYSMSAETNKDKVTLLSLVLGISSRNPNLQNSLMLSATPFTEGPLHMFSVMNLVNRRRLKSLNMDSSYNFFMNFIWEAWKFDVTIDGRKGLFATVDKYRNNMGLCNFMAAFSDFKITDEEIEKLRPVKYIIPDDENKIGGITSYVPLNEAQQIIKHSIGEFIVGRIKEDEICRITKEDDILEFDEDASEFDAEELVESGNLRKEEIMSARIFKAKSMQEKMVISPYLMGCMPKGVKLPPLDDVLKTKSGEPILWEGNTVPAAPKNFVENSPKILYAVECIRSVLQNHEMNDTPASGQIIYLNMGKNFIYQNIRYDAYQLIANYLTHPIYRPDIGLQPSDIGVIHGGIHDESMISEIQRRFNDGRIKVLLGSASIREGIDLQQNSTSMYIINAEYNPTNAMQLEGRIWRQGNKWKNVRVVYILAYDSIDVFIYSKLKNKINSVREIMRAGKCDLNETQVFSLDPGEVQINLTTNVNDLADLSWQNEERKMRLDLEKRNSEINLLRLINKNYPKIKTEYDNLLKQLNTLSQTLEEVKYKDLKDQVETKIRSAEREKALETTGHTPLTADEIEKQAVELINNGTYKKIYEHVDFKEDMAYTLFQQRLDVLRANYKIARQWEGRKLLHEKEIETLKKQIEDAIKERDRLESDIKNNPYVQPVENLADLGKPDQREKALAEANRFIDKWNADLYRAVNEKTKQQIYWETIISVGFTNFEDYEKAVNRFTSGSDNDTVLNAFNSQVTATGMSFSDVEDIVEKQQQEISKISARINNREKEIENLVEKFKKLLEERKKAGKFSLYDQINAYEGTNYLIK